MSINGKSFADYSEGSGLAGLQDVASAGYYINDTASNPSLDSDMLYAFCDGLFVVFFSILFKYPSIFICTWQTNIPREPLIY